MRILILNYEYPPIGGGGGAISEAIAKGLARNGHTITVVTTWFKNLKENKLEQGVKVVRLKSKRRSLFKSNPIEMLSWIRVCKKFLPVFMESKTFDLCLANFVLPGGEVALFLKRKYNLPFYVISHGHDIPWVKPYWQLAPLHLLAYRKLKKICNESEKNFIQSATMLQNINRFLGPRNTAKNIVIPNGLEKNSIKERLPREGQLRIIFVGRLVFQKDPLTLLKAIKILDTDNIDFCLDIYGDGLLRSKLERYVKGRMLASRVNFHGKVERDELLQAYRSADLMIAPSISEGMSISILEALSCGIYVITTRVSGNEEIIECKVNGDYVEAQNDVLLYDAIKNYYFQKHQFGFTVPKTFLKRFNTKYDWNNIIPKYEQELQAIPLFSNKVLHIIDTLWLGGAQTLLKNIFECESNTDQYFLFVLRETKPSILFENSQTEIYNSSSRWSPLPLFRLWSIIASRKINVVHCHLPRSQVFGFVLKCFLPKIRLVYHEHGDIYEKGWLLPLLLRIFQKRVDLFITCSNFMKDALLKKTKINAAKISVLYNCVKKCLPEENQISITNKMLRQKNGIEANDFVVGFAGRLIERKGWNDFLKAARITIEENSGSRILFLIAGIGPDMSKLKNKIREMGLSEYVVYIGFVEEMSSFYSITDCCVMSSQWEGLPLVQLEAMSCGVPLITYNGPGMNEVPTNNVDSLSVTQGDVQGLSEKILLLKENDRIRLKIKLAAQNTVMKMNPDAYCRDLESLYCLII